MSAHSCDVAVVGGGLVGTATAYELAKLGASAIVIDSDLPGRATDAGAGILSPETNPTLTGPSLEFALAAASHYRSLIPELAERGETDTGYARCGLLKVAVRDGEDDLFAEAAKTATATFKEVCEITPDDAAELFPPAARVRRALYSPAAARVDGRALNGALARSASELGVDRVGARALGVEVGAGRATGVRTDVGVISCGSVVIAGGAWTEQLATGLSGRIPVSPLKGQIVHLELPGADSARWPILQPVLSYYLVAWPGGRVACGGTLEADAGFDHRPTAGAVAQLLRECLINAPGLAEATLREVRVGLRPASADGDPLLGALSGVPTVLLATGHGAEGLLLGPYSGSLVARAALGETPAALDQFSPGRFD